MGLELIRFFFLQTNHQTEILPEWKPVLNTGKCLDINNQSNLASILCENNLVFLENRVIMSTLSKKYNIPCNVINYNVKYFQLGNSFLLMKGLKQKYLINLMYYKRISY